MGQVAEAEVEGVAICLANVNGELSALDNVCPHRQGPLGQGWVEGETVICPWHSWAFNARTGLAEYPVNERVECFRCGWRARTFWWILNDWVVG